MIDAYTHVFWELEAGVLATVAARKRLPRHLQGVLQHERAAQYPKAQIGLVYEAVRMMLGRLA